MNTTVEKIFSNWKTYFSYNPRIVISSVVLSFVSIFAFNFILTTYFEPRIGFSFNDPLLSMFTPIDISIPAAFIFYGLQIYCLTNIIKYPSKVIMGIQAYTLMVLVRTIIMAFMPLLPPVDTIVLYDPFMAIANGSANIPTKDLFFSGHTATIFLAYLLAATPKAKKILFAGTILIGAMMLIQKTHYTADVLSAPFFVYGCYRFIYVQIIRKHEL